MKPVGDIPVIRAQNVRPLNILKTNLLYIDNSISELLSRCALTKRSLLVTFIGAGIGDVATFDEEIRWHLAPNVAKMEPFENCDNLINVRFVNYFLMSDLGQKEIFKHVKATAQPSLSMSTIRDIDLPIPPLSIQNQIVAKLDELMKTCDDLENSIKQSQLQNEQLLQQVLKEALEVKEEIV
ncbi:restriction endonuclease subunit S [Pedobacter steynii]